MRLGCRLNRVGRIAIVAVLASGVGALACSRPSARSVNAPVLLGLPDAANSGAGAAANGATVVVAWASTAGEVTNIYAVRSRDGGATFSAPVRVNDVEGDARVNGEQPPRVVIGRDVVIAWESRGEGKSRVRFARSTDGGATFGAAMTAHQSELAGARGWASASLDAGGALHLAWLDGREAAAAAAAGHDHRGSMRQDLMHAVWRPDGTQTETQVATNVCFCCKTTVATAPDGTTFVAWRHVYPTNLRDIAVARSADGVTFDAPVRVSEDHWQIDACPEDGPSMAVDARGVLHIVWPTMVEGPRPAKGIFYAYSTDHGRTFAPRVRIDDASAIGVGSAHPQLALAGGGVVVAWDESSAEGRRVRVRELRSTDAGVWTPRLQPAVGVDAAAGQYPVLAGVPGGVLIAWTRTGASGSVVATTTVPLTPR